MTLLHHGDCLDILPTLPKHSVDLVLTDPPYGTTACKWDAVIPLKPMWRELHRVIKPHRAIVLTAIQPFTTTLIVSNPAMFKYCWVWEKNVVAGFAHAKNKPMSKHEDIIVFSTGAVAHKTRSRQRMPYFPQGLTRLEKPLRKLTTNNVTGFMPRPSQTEFVTQTHTGYPSTVLQFDCERAGFHPTQKPVALMAYLINTYTRRGATVLDFTMGSGTTGVACAETGRQFIGIERNRDYFGVANDRIAAAVSDSQSQAA